MSNELQTALAKATEEGYDTLLPEIFEAARQHLADKPYVDIMRNSMVFNADGTLLLEWAKRKENGRMTMLSIILAGEDVILSVMVDGEPLYNAALEGINPALIKNREGENK